MTTRERWTLAAAILASGIVFLDSTVVNVALPSIGRELPGSAVGVLEGESYVYLAYLLSLSSLLIVAGALTDRLGRRRILAFGLVGFGATSALCGAAPTMELLIAGRLLQGAAGAFLVPASLAIITATFEGERRGRAIGLWAGTSGITTILGPLVGGVLVDTISWRAVFLINLPLVAVALWATWRYVQESRDESASGGFDWFGAIVVAVAIGGLTFGAIRGEEQQWHDPLAFAALAVGATAALAFPFLMARSPHPLVPLSLFRSRNFSVTNLSTLLIYGALYVSFYYLNLYLQGTVGYTASAAGVAGIPSSILLVLFSPRFGALAGRFGPRRFMAAGPAIMAVGILWYARVPDRMAAWTWHPGDVASLMPPASYFVDILPANIVFGIGLTMMVAPLTTALMSSVPVRNSGLASAINNAISRVGPQLAGALIFVIITAAFWSVLASTAPVVASSPTLHAAISPLNPPPAALPATTAAAIQAASTDSFRLAMLVAAVLLVSGSIVNWLGIRDADARSAPDVATAGVAA
jgi:EmrB/QacA subfamily drug resistance transporter